ncbi:MAG TPA: PD-(D/E)XK nuclease family protein [bacterium]|nr:PD-(D/E)XK nuclease family protein [bacterium]
MATNTPLARRRVLHRGPFQPALEEALVDEVRRVRDADPLMPVVVLCPTPLLCLHLKRRLAAGGGHAGVRFFTVNDLASLLGAETMSEAGLSRLPEGADRVLWHRAVAAMPAAGFFAPIHHARGFPAAARQTIRELKEAGLVPAAIGARAKGDTRLDRKLRELVRLWSRVDTDTAAAGFFDDLDLLRAAAAVAGEDPPALRGVAAFLYGFHHLPHLHRRLVTGFLAREVAAAFVPWADDDPAFEFVAPTYDFLQGTLELFPDDSANVAPRPLVENLRVIAAPGDVREALEVARVVAGAAGALHETGVLMRTPAGLATRLDTALDDAGIPHYLPGELPLGHLPAARALRLLLEARREEMPRATVIDLLITTPLRFPEILGELAEGAAPGVWDGLTRDWGIVSGATEWRVRVAAGIEELRRGIERDRAGGLEEPRPGAQDRLLRATALQRTIATLQAALDGIPESGRWSELAAALERAWRALFDFGAEDAPVLEAIQAVARLDALAQDPQSPLGRGTLDEVSELLDDALSAARPSGDSFEGTGVFVADLARARGLPFRTVIVPGMVEGLFPRVPQPDPLLSDAERRHLNNALSAASELAADDETVDATPDAQGADGPIPLRSATAAEERFYFRLALDAARERVVFTLPRLDSETGRERLPSWLLLSLVERRLGANRALTVPEFAEATMVEWMPLDPAPARRGEALTRLERDLHDLRAALGDVAGARETPGGADPAPATFARVARLLARNPFAEHVLASERNRWGEHRFTVHDGWLVPAAGDAEWRAALDAVAFRPGAEVSATRLETYANCPYRYFLRYGLGLAALEEPERQLTVNPLERGELIHAALERFWREEMRAHTVPIPEEAMAAAQERIAAIAHRLLDDFARTGITGPRVFWEQTRREIVEDLRHAVEIAVEADSAWEPAEVELGFGSALPGEAAPPSIGPVAAGSGISFRGRIDRVDRSVDGSAGRVVDYKSGAASIHFRARRGEDPSVFRGGAQLQLPIYVLAARQRFPEVTQWEAIYDYCTRRGEFERPQVPVSDEVLARLLELVQRLAADATAGKFPFIAGNHCDRCDYRDVCGPAHDVAFEAKAGDPAFAPFLERREEFR